MKKPKLKKPPKVKVSVPLETGVVTVTGPGDSAKTVKDHPNAHPMALRIEACAAYVADMSSCTVESLSKIPKFAHIPVATLRLWAKQDGWMQYRKQAYAAVKARLLGEAQKTLTDQLYREVQELQKWNEKASFLLELPTTLPSSWEGVMKVKMAINARLGEISKLVTEGLVDEVGKSVTTTQSTAQVSGPRPQYDPKALQSLAKAITAKSRQELRAKIASTLPPTKEKEDGSATVAQDLPEEEITPELSPPVGGDPGGDKGDAD